MRKQVKTCLITAWIVAAIVIFLMGTDLCASTDEACFQAGESMFRLLFLLTFPTGTVFFFASLIFLQGESIHYPSDFITAWFIMTLAGLLQWFVLVPAIFEKRELTTLNLKAVAAPRGEHDLTDPAGNVPELVGPTETVAVSKPKTFVPDDIAEVARPRKPRRRSIKLVSAFDGKGRTPLERVIDRL